MKILKGLEVADRRNLIERLHSIAPSVDSLERDAGPVAGVFDIAVENDLECGPRPGSLVVEAV